jgi:hypothetical protein
MKKPKHLSPTSLSLFYKNPEEYYLMYLSDKAPDKFPQTKPMAVGSAFDAYAKSYLHEKIFGVGNDPKFELSAIFEAQVEPQNRDEAKKAGEYCFEIYKKSGALGDLLLDLSKAVGPPKFELEVKGVINGYREGVTLDVGGVHLLGKPDVFYINKLGAHVVFDWKVNGYYSAYNISPMQGYVRLREQGTNKGQHKSCQLMSHNGVMINIGQYLEQLNEDWARQLGIYGWLCGEDIGNDFIVAVDQLVCKPLDMAPRPAIRVAEHRLRISREFQWKTFAQAQRAWEIANSNHFFRDMSFEDSAARCATLDQMAESLKGDGSDEDDWFRKVSRQ